MYIVRRPFRNYNQMMTPGSVVEPGNIKRFKTRLKDRYIVEVTAQTFDMWNEYFEGKFGISLKAIADANADANADNDANAEKEADTNKVVARVVAQVVNN